MGGTAGFCTGSQLSVHLTDSPFHSAFNNILSNLGYVMLGLLFLLIVLKRDIVHNRALVRNDLNALVRQEGVKDREAPASRLGSDSSSPLIDLTAPTSVPFPLQECGIPKHFGLFYAMGTALMMEGLLSACYHVCPNYTNFQFGERAGMWSRPKVT